MSSSNALVTMRAFTREDDVILLKSGEVLFRPGETGTTMFGLLEGAIRTLGLDKLARMVMKTSPLAMFLGQGRWSWKDTSGLVWQQQPRIAA